MNVVMDGISSSHHGKSKTLFERTPMWMTVRGENVGHSLGIPLRKDGVVHMLTPCVTHLSTLLSGGHWGYFLF